MYLNGCVVDYVETLEAAGFKFENPKYQEHLRLRIVDSAPKRRASSSPAGTARE